MPSPKAVLRDIHDLRLDPRFPHVATGKDGRIVVSTKPAVEAKPAAKTNPVVEAKLQPTLPTQETKPVQTEDVTVVASSKKNKAAKADKPAE
jgi:hypothetical protein